MKTFTERIQRVVPPCPKCGKKVDWANDIPLRAFCWGTEEMPHAEMTALIPRPVNPYIPKHIKVPKALLGWKTEAQWRTIMRKYEALDNQNER